MSIPALAFLTLAGVLLVFFVSLHIRQNRRLAREMQRHAVPKRLARSITIITLERAVMFWVVLAGCFVLMGVQLYQRGNPRPAAVTVVEAVAEKPAPQAVENQAPEITPQPAPEPVPATASSAPEPVTEPTPQPVPLVSAPAPQPAATLQEPPLPVPAAAQPPLSREARESALDKLKQRYETLFVNYYYLAHCDAAGPEDEKSLTAAMRIALSEARAPAPMEANILTAARGTYREVYSRSPCNPPQIEAQRRELERFLR